jgi:hypothetical protein
MLVATTVIRIQAVEGLYYRLRPSAFWRGPEITLDPCRRCEIKQHDARFLVPKSGLVDRPYDAVGGFDQRAGIGTGNRQPDRACDVGLRIGRLEAVRFDEYGQVRCIENAAIVCRLLRYARRDEATRFWCGDTKQDSVTY